MSGMCLSLKKRYGSGNSFNLKDNKPDICQPAALTGKKLLTRCVVLWPALAGSANYRSSTEFMYKSVGRAVPTGASCYQNNSIDSKPRCGGVFHMLLQGRAP